MLATSVLLVGCNHKNTGSDSGKIPVNSEISESEESIESSENLGGSGNGENSESTGENENSSSDTGSENFKVCGIQYRYCDQTTGVLKDIPALMWKAEGAYPTAYKENSEKKIDDLRHIRKDNATICAFEGWYYDADFTNALKSNKVAVSVRGDITLYAKIVERAKKDGDVVTATISYQWNNYGDVTDGIENFPEAMTSGLKIPTEYVEGETVALPKLNMWRKNSKLVYEFEGWYYDEELKNKVSGEVISAAQTGNITLYAKVAAYIN